MTIVIVEDNYRFIGSGATMSTKRFREELIKLGHTVRILGIGVEGEDMYGIEDNNVPVISKIALKNNMHFGKFNKEIAAKAFEGADLVHIIFPWQNGQRCNVLAKSMGIPVTAAFHCQPQNMTYYLRLNKIEIVNRLIFYIFKKRLYGNVDNIHCPSDFTARELIRHNYKARLHVISNGILDCFTPLKTPVEKIDNKIHILMTGRLSHEKCQFLLIKAAMCSKYKDRIQLHFVGRGPREKSYKKLGSKLPLQPIFYTAFLPQNELIALIQSMDLYVHTSEVELEGLACMEAIACCKVPIIANSKTSATPQFALDERSLFKEGKHLDLSNKIDYWIEHPQEREQMGKEYANLRTHYNIGNSAIQLEKFFIDAIRDHKIKTEI